MPLAALHTNEEPRDNTPEENFRLLIKDVIPVIEHMALVCNSADEMVGMLKLAQKNNGQLSLIMNLMASK